MKKHYFTIAALLVPVFLCNAQDMQEIEGVPVLVDFYCHRTSTDGTQLVGEAEDGSTVYYNIPENKFYNYPDCTFGRGNVVSDEGTVVGCQLLESDTQSTVGVLMKDGVITIPSILKGYMSSDIHSITPDGQRICGVIGNSGSGQSHFPFYCDKDANGNFSEVKFLPYPKEDFFGDVPQYCSATCMSEDGKTIVGQVIDSHGAFIYPIQYTENEKGEWNYYYPSKSLFNTENLPLPEPFKEFDMEEPEPTNWMDEKEKEEWEAAKLKWEQNSFAPEYSPYDHLEWFLTDEEIMEYEAALAEYEEAAEKYNEQYFSFWEQYYAILDCSVGFERNSMALSPNGQWMASAQVLDFIPEDSMDYIEILYRPYRFNLVKDENIALADAEYNLGISQVFDNGDVICVTPVASVLPPRSWLYINSEKKLISIEDYIKDVNPTYGKWYENNLYAYIPVAENEDGSFSFTWATITGLVTANEDMTMLVGAIIGDAIDFGANLSYIFTGLPAGVEGIEAESSIAESYTVYNLQGVKVMTTKERGDLINLSKGIYIINGKKVII